MSEMWQGVALGALFAIPLGIIVNLISPRIQQLVDRRSERSAAKRAQQDVVFRDRVSALAKDRSALYVELLDTLLRVAYFTALFGVLSGALFFLGQVLPYMGLISSVILALGQVTAFIGALTVLNVVRPAVALVREIRATSETDKT
ncbi:hypothetical protein [Leucobacter japonicus]|uniref:hypothetical protein n=1 Tax=Leucobacter japonicus TaxID=1461259 RepID=UPI0006A7E012|nr:hypothetical protein [Leucobacter japonicus]